jgi:hypothetical protein
MPAMMSAAERVNGHELIARVLRPPGRGALRVHIDHQRAGRLGADRGKTHRRGGLPNPALVGNDRHNGASSLPPNL